MPSSSDKAKLFAENDSMTLGLSLYLELQNIPATPKLVKKTINVLDSSKASESECIPVVVLCEPEQLNSWTFQYMSEGIKFSE